MDNVHGASKMKPEDVCDPVDYSVPPPPSTLTKSHTIKKNKFFAGKVNLKYVPDRQKQTTTGLSRTVRGRDSRRNEFWY